MPRRRQWRRRMWRRYRASSRSPTSSGFRCGRSRAARTSATAARAPRMPGTVMLDLGRMNRIIEVNEAQGYCIVEPGVGFFDLYDHLQKNKIALQMGIPGNAWGSVMGNALERGFSPAGRPQQQHLRPGTGAGQWRGRAHRHGRHGQRQGLAAVQARLRSVVGPDDRAVQLRHRHEDVPVDEARGRSGHQHRHQARQARRAGMVHAGGDTAATEERARRTCTPHQLPVLGHGADAAQRVVHRAGFHTRRRHREDEGKAQRGLVERHAAAGRLQRGVRGQPEDRAGAVREVHAAGIPGGAHGRFSARRPDHVPAADDQLVWRSRRAHRLFAGHAGRRAAGAAAVRAHAQALPGVRARLFRARSTTTGAVSPT